MTTEDKRATLLAQLQTALELELSTIPPYLVALLSMKLSANRQAADLIRSVMIEEMLHLALVANVLNAVGGTATIGPDNIPSYPLKLNFHGKEFTDRRVPVNLAPFTKDNVLTFMKIEEPQAPPALRAALEKEIDIDGLTIGEFYLNIVRLLEELEAEEPGTLFIGDFARQLEDDYYWGGGGRIIAVSDLDSAKRALEIVITQGEGAWRRLDAFHPEKPLELGHYYRFSEIYYQRHYTKDDDPAAPPTGAPLPIDYSAVHPIKVNPKADDYAPGSPLAKENAAFNGRYTAMLRQIEEAITGTPRVLYTAIMNGMHGLTSIATTMMTTAIDGDPEGRTGCPTFDWVEEDD